MTLLHGKEWSSTGRADLSARCSGSAADDTRSFPHRVTEKGRRCGRPSIRMQDAAPGPQRDATSFSSGVMRRTATRRLTALAVCVFSFR